jgi:hypothetical protein
VLFGLPLIALLLGLIFGGSLQTADLGPVLIKLASIVLAAVLTAVPFAGVHVPPPGGTQGSAAPLSPHPPLRPFPGVCHARASMFNQLCRDCPGLSTAGHAIGPDR